MKEQKLKVTEGALIQRINRKLKPEMMALKVARTVRATLDVGRYYVLDHTRNFVVEKGVCLEQYGRQLGVLREYEEVA